MKPEHTACTSKAAPWVTPSIACTRVAVAGKVSSGVAVARTIRSSASASMPAAASARRAAAQARSRGHLALGGDVALADAGALDDPLVRRVDHAGQVVVGQDAFGEIGPASDDGGPEHHQDAARLCWTGSLSAPNTSSSLVITPLKPFTAMSTATPMALAKPIVSVPPWLLTTMPLSPTSMAPL